MADRQDPTLMIVFVNENGEEIGEAKSTACPRSGERITLLQDRHQPFGPMVQYTVVSVSWMHRPSARGAWDHTLTAHVVVAPCLGGGT